MAQLGGARLRSSGLASAPQRDLAHCEPACADWPLIPNRLRRPSPLPPLAIGYERDGCWKRMLSAVPTWRRFFCLSSADKVRSDPQGGGRRRCGREYRRLLGVRGRQGALVYSFESEPSNFSLLCSQCSSFRRNVQAQVTVVKKQRRALSANFPFPFPCTTRGATRVRSSSIAFSLRRGSRAMRGSDRVDLLKLDVEGGELEKFSMAPQRLSQRSARSDWSITTDGLTQILSVASRRWTEHLDERGFSRTFVRPTSHSSGIAWHRQRL